MSELVFAPSSMADFLTKILGGLGNHFADGTTSYAIWGTPKDCIHKLEQYVSSTGVNHFTLDVRPATISLETIQLLSGGVVPHFQKRQHMRIITQPETVCPCTNGVWMQSFLDSPSGE